MLFKDFLPERNRGECVVMPSAPDRPVSARRAEKQIKSARERKNTLTGSCQKKQAGTTVPAPARFILILFPICKRLQ